MITPALIRTVPEEIDPQVEAWWEHACELHPDWAHLTFRDPIDPDLFPISSVHWSSCQNGAQLAGLIRLEALIRHGGIYLDSDVELYRPLHALLGLDAFAAWEDECTVPDAVLGAKPNHPAFIDCLHLAIERLHSDSIDWRIGPGAWSTGPGVTTTILPNRPDVLLLPPASFYPVHYTRRDDTRSHEPSAYSFGIHHWAASWL